MKALETIREMPAIKALQGLGGEIYLVGGIVRDSFLKKESKDIDLIVRLVPMESIVDTLRQFGKIEQVGESFAVLKFIPLGWKEEPIDIALPRTETKIGDGHKGFDVQSDFMLSIEEDLIRRDITINSIAVSLDGKVIDPFGGVDDITKYKAIKATSTKSFSDDPLRMLRCVQFASRFDFDIEQETFEMIKKHSSLIKQISGERMKGELDKIQTKGKLSKAVEILNSTGMAEHMFGQNFKLTGNYFFETSAEFYAHLFQDFNEPEKVFSETLKGDTVTTKLIKAISFLRRQVTTMSTETEVRILFAQAIRMSYDDLLNLKTIPDFIGDVYNDFADGMPKRVTELKINGEQLMEKGLKGREIGSTLNRLLEAVLSKELTNKEEELLAAV